MKLSVEETDKLIEARISEMMKEDPIRLALYMLSIFGREAVEANAATMKFTTEATFGNNRYEVTASVKTKKIKQKPNTHPTNNQ